MSFKKKKEVQFQYHAIDASKTLDDSASLEQLSCKILVHRIVLECVFCLSRFFRALPRRVSLLCVLCAEQLVLISIYSSEYTQLKR